MRASVLAGLLLLAPVAARAQSAEDLAKSQFRRTPLLEKSLADLSNPQMSENGRIALGVNPKRWRHAESEHFILHSQSATVQDRLGPEAEFFYWKTAQDFQLSKDLGYAKSHIFAFENQQDWQAFQARSGILNVLGVTTGEREFFCYDPAHQTRDSSGVVAHEMTHLVFFRFFRSQPPLWLNEGLAEFQSRRCLDAFYNHRPTAPRPHPDAAALDFMAMTRQTGYPGGAALPAFYTKSRLAVQVLYERGGPERLVKFINAMIENGDFSAAFGAVYRDVFGTTDRFLQELARKERRS